MTDIIDADFISSEHGDAIIGLLDSYACDIMGGGERLPESVRHHLVAELARRDNAHAVLAYVEDEPAGLAICFEVFSTFENTVLKTVVFKTDTNIIAVNSTNN